MNFQSFEGISLLPYNWYVSIHRPLYHFLKSIYFTILAYYVLVASIAITFPQLTKCQSHETYETSGSSSFQSSNGISEDCAPAAMARCTDPLKVVTDNRDLGFATSMDELQEMCPYDIYIKEYYIDILNIFIQGLNILIIICCNFQLFQKINGRLTLHWWLYR